MTGRSIAKSGAVDTFNQSWSASGPFTGYRPYASGGPDVLWAEGTAEVRWAYRFLPGRQATGNALDKAMGAWDAVTSKAPLGR